MLCTAASRGSEGSQQPEAGGFSEKPVGLHRYSASSWLCQHPEPHGARCGRGSAQPVAQPPRGLAAFVAAAGCARSAAWRTLQRLKTTGERKAARLPFAVRREKLSQEKRRLFFGAYWERGPCLRGRHSSSAEERGKRDEWRSCRQLLGRQEVHPAGSDGRVLAWWGHCPRAGWLLGRWGQGLCDAQAARRAACPKRLWELPSQKLLWELPAPVPSYLTVVRKMLERRSVSPAKTLARLWRRHREPTCKSPLLGRHTLCPAQAQAAGPCASALCLSQENKD